MIRAQLSKLLPAAVLTAALAACGSEQTNDFEAQADIVRPAKVVEVSAGQELDQRVFPGRVEAPRTSTLSFEVGGQLVELPVLEGQPVQKGDLIAALDADDYQERVNEAAARVRLLTNQRSRQQRLLEGGATSRAEFDQVAAEFDIARAALATAERNLAQTRLVAPYDGTIAERIADPFTQIRPGQEIALLQDDTQIDIVIQIPQHLAANAKVSPPELSASFEFAPEQQYPLAIKEFETTPTSGNGGYRVVLTMDKPEGFDLLPGMTGKVRARFLSTMEADIHVPVASLVGDQDAGFAVFVWNEETSAVTRTPVEIGTVTSGSAEVLSGLERDAMVVAAGSAFLRDGMRVRPLSE